MSEPNMEDEMTNAVPEKKKMGAGAKVAIGCGSGCLVVVLLFIIAGVVGGVYLKKVVAKNEAELQALGFDTVIKEQVLDVTSPISEPVLLEGQVVRIMADCSTNIAVLAQSCEIHSVVSGKVYFRGQILTVQPNGAVLGGIDAKAQVIQNHGLINPPVSGEYQVFQDDAGSNGEPVSQ